MRSSRKSVCLWRLSKRFSSLSAGVLRSPRTWVPGFFGGSSSVAPFLRRPVCRQRPISRISGPPSTWAGSSNEGFCTLPVGGIW